MLIGPSGKQGVAPPGRLRLRQNFFELAGRHVYWNRLICASDQARHGVWW